MTIMKKFEIGKEYRCTGIYGGEYVIKVVGRTEDTVSFIYGKGTSSDRSVQTAEVQIQGITVYDKDLDEVGCVDSESIVAWKYHSLYADPDEYNYGYYFAFDNTRGYTREELEAMDDGYGEGMEEGERDNMCMTVGSREKAWEEAKKIFPYEYLLDDESSAKAGCPILRSTASGHPGNWISDLGDRLEINLEDGSSVSIWIKPNQGPKERTYTERIRYAEGKGNSQHMLQHLAADILRYGKILSECHHASQEFHPDGTERTIETGMYCIEALNEITGYRYWVHFSGCRVTEIIESRIVRC